jgi:hypothetical protein
MEAASDARCRFMMGVSISTGNGRLHQDSHVLVGSAVLWCARSRGEGVRTLNLLPVFLCAITQHAEVFWRLTGLIDSSCVDVECYSTSGDGLNSQASSANRSHFGLGGFDSILMAKTLQAGWQAMIHQIRRPLATLAQPATSAI